MADPDPKEVARGFFQVELDSWESFQNYILKLSQYSDYVWRGQRDSAWTLESTLDRLIRKYEVVEPFFKKRHLDRFKLATRGRRGDNPSSLEDDGEWWALGQHHGLATPLLDWSRSPFVAAFFAFLKSEKAQSGFRAVYALHLSSAAGLTNSKLEKEKAERKERKEHGDMQIGDLLNFDPTSELSVIQPEANENRRLVNQAGLFTWLKKDYGSVENWLLQNSGLIEGNGAVLLKVLVPDSERETALRMLNRMNINPASLFPDIEGASLHANLHAEIADY